MITSCAPKAVHAREPRDPPEQLIYTTIAACFVAFAAWGSLFPFDFHRVPFSFLFASFWSDWQAGLATWSLTDLLSNVLLFVPVGLFLAAATEKTWPAWGRSGLAAAAVFLAGTIASGSLEVGQAFVSWRTPSIVDVLAESLGTACGIGLWHLTGTELDSLFRRAAQTIRRATRSERILLVYGLSFGALWLMPADFTLRPAEIGDKYEHKRLLLPFTPAPDALSRPELALTVVSAIPVGLAAALCGCGPRARRSVVRGAVLAAAMLLVLELAQVLVFSRTTDGTAFVAALAGAFLGSVAAIVTNRTNVIGLELGVVRVVLPIMVWLAAAVLSEGSPFHVDPIQARLQMLIWSRTPFRLPVSALDVVPGAVLALLAGVFVGRRLSHELGRLQTLIAVGLAGALFLTFELGRVVLVNRTPSLVSVLIKVLALLAGLCGASARSSRLVPTRARADS